AAPGLRLRREAASSERPKPGRSGSLAASGRICALCREEILLRGTARLRALAADVAEGLALARSARCGRGGERERRGLRGARGARESPCGPRRVAGRQARS